MPEQCPFCQLVENEEQTFHVHESENFRAWLDINPRARGHTMVVPKEHVESMDDMGERVSELFEVVRIVAEKARNGLGADGVSIVLNDGEAAGQRIDHFYAQVFPRYEGEENEGAPAGAVFQPLEDVEESQLEEWSGAMRDAGFQEFGDTRGAYADVMKRNRGTEVDEEEDTEEDDKNLDRDPAEFR
ncbi:MAG: HIT family protein, partial [Candidatus Nanohaloarchaea archaeon]